MNRRNLRHIWNGLVAVLGSLALCAGCLAWAQTTNAEEASPGQSTNAPAAEVDVAGSSTTNASSAERTGGMIKAKAHRRTGSGEPLVAFGQNVEVKAGETREAVVVFGGSAKVNGQVRDAVVIIGGTAEISGEVGNAVVCVFGNVQLIPGARIHGAAVTVFGNLEVQDGAGVDGDAVSVLGKLDVARADAVKGKVVNVLAGQFPSFEPFRRFFVQCVLKLRPLAPGVGWVWPVAGVFLLLYVLVAVAFPRPVQHCVDELTRRPATTFLIGLLTKMLIPIVALILVATGIGIFIVPFLGAAVLFAGIVGKVALLQYFGQQLGKQFSRGTALQPLVALLIGAALLTVLYIVPVLGLLALLTTGLWALGAAVMALFGGMRRENPERAQPPASPPPAAPAPIVPVDLGGTAPAVGPAPALMGTPDGSAQPFGTRSVPELAAPPVATATSAPPTPEAWSLPRAGFWERMGAAFLDMILVGILSGLIGRGPLGLLVTLAYFSGMWAWKGTTVGGVVLKLKVVRLDGQPITFPVALVRGLAGAFSTVVLFLGILWIAWDKDKQGWHDKIAGTVVVRLPHTQSLVCI
jgi:uncharacterized RDD family membrane protein YckC/cytoskeletal protein CcmA (bactofilin family)